MTDNFTDAANVPVVINLPGFGDYAFGELTLAQWALLAGQMVAEQTERIGQLERVSPAAAAAAAVDLVNRPCLFSAVTDWALSPSGAIRALLLAARPLDNGPALTFAALAANVQSKAVVNALWKVLGLPPEPNGGQADQKKTAALQPPNPAPVPPLTGT